MYEVEIMMARVDKYLGSVNGYKDEATAANKGSAEMMTASDSTVK